MLDSPPTTASIVRRPIWALNIGLIVAFLLLSLAGAGLLLIPAATYSIQDKPFYFNDALFTAVSAICVTGLPLRDTATTFTPLGQSVILVLMQLGGLGVMLYGTVLALLIGRNLSATTNPLEPHASADTGLISRTIVFVVVTTFVIELAGAAFMFPMFMDLPGTKGDAVESAWYSIFHSVSAFCNAGFTLYANKLMQGAGEGGATPLRDHWQVMGVIAPLIVIGGLGYPVLHDCARFVKTKILRLGNDAGYRGPTLHTKMVLTTTVSLIVLGASGLMLLERPVSSRSRVQGAFAAKIDGPAKRAESDWYDLGQLGQIRESFFQSISARTAGFNTIDLSRLSNGGKLWMSCLMIIGASPASTGGGMKTVTFAVLLLTVWSVLRRREEVEAFERRIGADMLRKSLTLAILYIGFVGLITLAVTLTMDPRESFIDILFESCSACGTVGLSTGLTPKLTENAKIAIMVAMFLGRVGPMTLLLAMTTKGRYTHNSFPTENVLIG